MEQQVGDVGSLQPPAGQIGLGRRAGDRDRAREDELDLTYGALGPLLP